MEIRNHRLANNPPITFVPSPNIGGEVEHRLLVMHFTAGSSAKESIDWLASRKSQASAHLVIGRDGTITQLVPFNRIAWHAGASSWEGLNGINKYSIGIELDNPGKLTRKNNRWRAWFGAEYEPDEVIEAAHKNEQDPAGWLLYTPEQISAALEVAGLLISKYGLKEVVGHEDIAPGRKCDPGPAFPMANFRARLLGRKEDELPLYSTTAELNVRTGPGVQHPVVAGSPLPPGTPVSFVTAQGTWWLVQPAGISTVDEGWVNSRFLVRAGGSGVRPAPGP